MMDQVFRFCWGRYSLYMSREGKTAQGRANRPPCPGVPLGRERLVFECTASEYIWQHEAIAF